MGVIHAGRDSVTAPTVAALYVDPRGCYSELEGVDPWGPDRDARKYAGPHAVVAHPPCTRWCMLAGLVEARYPQHKAGEDGGCFEAALASVRRWGGVLEHPAWTRAWVAFELNTPPRSGGWIRASLTCGGWVCHVEQLRYGHAARKATWLYARGVDLPSLRWGHSAKADAPALVSWCGNHVPDSESRPRIGKREAAATPPEFRAMLLEMARSRPG